MLASEALHFEQLEPLSVDLIRQLHDPARQLERRQELQGAFMDFALAAYGARSPHEFTRALYCAALEELDPKRVEDTARSIGEHDVVLYGARNVIERTHRQADAILRELPPGIPLERRSVAAADLMAQKAHDGQFRRSGGPFYLHPKQTAAMIHHIFERLEVENGHAIDRHFKNATLALALLHDADEDTIRSQQFDNPDRPQGFSPLLVRMVLAQCGNQYAASVATGLRLMTHDTDQPWAPDYKTYLFLGSTNIFFCLVKLADIRHNWKIDPKPYTDATKAKVLAKNKEYDDGFEQLCIVAPHHAADDPCMFTWLSDYSTILRSIKPTDIGTITNAFDSYMYGGAKAA